MKNSDFQNSPLHASEPPVETAADALTSNSPDALPTCAPDALLCPTRVELNARWLTHFPSYAAVTTWNELLRAFDALALRPELN